jgi:hypothetical protein
VVEGESEDSLNSSFSPMFKSLLTLKDKQKKSQLEKQFIGQQQVSVHPVESEDCAKKIQGDIDLVETEEGAAKQLQSGESQNVNHATNVSEPRENCANAIVDKNADYVYDIYCLHPGKCDSSNVATLMWKDELVYEEEDSSDEECFEDEEDSNSEDYWANDYPDEEEHRYNDFVYDGFDVSDNNHGTAFIADTHGATHGGHGDTIIAATEPGFFSFSMM